MKATTVRLERGDAKELLLKTESELTGLRGTQARQAVAKLLNTGVQTYNWVGVYVVDGKDLLLDAWAGPVATEHTRIPIGNGICGFAAKAGRTEIVSDVSKDPRYIECFLSTKAEIVVPIFNQGTVVGEIDIDSDTPSAFSSLDREFLEAVAKKLSQYW